MDSINENKLIVLNQKETNENEYSNNTSKKNQQEKINSEKESKEKMSPKNRYIDKEVDAILERDPLEELKMIQQKIKNENSKIKQINSQLEKINNNIPVIKKNSDFKDDFDTYMYNKKKPNNNLLSPNIYVSSSQHIAKSNSLKLDPSLDEVFQKMENLRKIKIEKINDKKIDIEDPNNLSEKRYVYTSKKDKDAANKIDMRILALEEEVKKDKEEKQKKYDIKVKLFREKELEREKQRKKIINQINNISVSPKNKYLPKKDYITSEEREQMRKLKEESLLKIEKEKRKFKYLPISSEELNNFSNEVKKNEKILKSELSKKKKQMEELWKERKNLLPKYHSKFMDLNIKLDNVSKEELILKQEKLKNKELERANFGKEVIKNYRPKVLNKLKTERIERIKELQGINRFDNIKELGNKLKQKSVKLVNSQPKNFKKDNIFIYEETVKEKQTKKLTGKPVDFLLECRLKKALIDNEELMQDNSAKKIKEWQEMLDCGGSNAYNNVERVKMQAAVMNDKANYINQRLKQEPNTSKKDQLSQEASNLYINSIQAKLQILNKLYNSEN